MILNCKEICFGLSRIDYHVIGIMQSFIKPNIYKKAPILFSTDF